MKFEGVYLKFAYMLDTCSEDALSGGPSWGHSHHRGGWVADSPHGEKPPVPKRHESLAPRRKKSKGRLSDTDRSQRVCTGLWHWYRFAQ